MNLIVAILMTYSAFCASASVACTRTLHLSSSSRAAAGGRISTPVSLRCLNSKSRAVSPFLGGVASFSFGRNVLGTITIDFVTSPSVAHEGGTLFVRAVAATASATSASISSMLMRVSYITNCSSVTRRTNKWPFDAYSPGGVSILSFATNDAASAGVAAPTLFVSTPESSPQASASAKVSTAFILVCCAWAKDKTQAIPRQQPPSSFASSDPCTSVKSVVKKAFRANSRKFADKNSESLFHVLVPFS